jgi:hypothetical protein
MPPDVWINGRPTLAVRRPGGDGDQRGCQDRPALARGEQVLLGADGDRRDGTPSCALARTASGSGWPSRIAAVCTATAPIANSAASTIMSGWAASARVQRRVEPHEVHSNYGFKRAQVSQ